MPAYTGEPYHNKGIAQERQLAPSGSRIHTISTASLGQPPSSADQTPFDHQATTQNVLLQYYIDGTAPSFAPADRLTVRFLDPSEPVPSAAASSPPEIVLNGNFTIGGQSPSVPFTRIGMRELYLLAESTSGINWSVDTRGGGTVAPGAVADWARGIIRFPSTLTNLVVSATQGGAATSSFGRGSTIWVRGTIGSPYRDVEVRVRVVDSTGAVVGTATSTVMVPTTGTGFEVSFSVANTFGAVPAGNYGFQITLNPMGLNRIATFDGSERYVWWDTGQPTGYVVSGDRLSLTRTNAFALTGAPVTIPPSGAQAGEPWRGHSRVVVWDATSQVVAASLSVQAITVETASGDTTIWQDFPGGVYTLRLELARQGLPSFGAPNEYEVQVVIPESSPATVLGTTGPQPLSGSASELITIPFRFDNNPLTTDVQDAIRRGMVELLLTLRKTTTVSWVANSRGTGGNVTGGTIAWARGYVQAVSVVRDVSWASVSGGVQPAVIAYPDNVFVNVLLDTGYETSELRARLMRLGVVTDTAVVTGAGPNYEFNFGPSSDFTVADYYDLNLAFTSNNGAGAVPTFGGDPKFTF